MRKYFLLGVAALMTTTSVNAKTDYAEVTAKATIEVATNFTCDEIDWGTIVVKQNNRQFTIYGTDSNGNIDDYFGPDSSELISASKYPSFRCNFNGESYNQHFSNFSETFDITNENGDKISATVGSEGENEVTFLTIPANVKPGNYTGAVTISYTY